MFENNPILGVGFGMYGFISSEYYPQYAWLSSEILDRSLNYSAGEAWPPVHSWILRLLGETGMFGCGLWIAAVVSVIYYMWSLKKNSLDNESFSNVIIISFIGSFIMQFKSDTIYSIPFWIMMALPFVKNEVIVRGR
jgi:O-antigen ligase